MDAFGNLERSDFGLERRDDLGFARTRPWFGHNDGGHRFAQIGVGYTDHRGLANARQ